MEDSTRVGERRADVEAVFREHHDFVWRTLYHLGVPRDHVDDALQMVFIVVHRRIRDFDGRSSIRNWLYGIARRVASDQRRRRERHATHLRVVRDPEDQEDDARIPERVSASDLVTSFLESLDDEKREVFLLAELEGMTAPEIAEATGVNVNTVYGRMRAARQLFQRAVERLRVRQLREQACPR